MTVREPPLSTLAAEPLARVGKNASVLILTLNEEANLPACLEAVSWSDDIVVLDSFSTDRTVEIARKAGARVFQREHDSELGQRNYGLSSIPFRNEWVYMPDADEVTTPELREEILSVVRDPGRPEAAFRVRFKVMFMGRWIKHSSLYPTWVVRLVRPRHVRFERAFHTACFGEGPEGQLSSHFLHYSFNKGMNAWYEKHNRYSWHEAQEALEFRLTHRPDFAGLFSQDPRRRRQALKRLTYWMPFRPALRFFYMYLFRLGFLDGAAGLTYCRLIAVYEHMIVVKMAELRRRQKGLPV
ncbi:glycosyltransferase family 2 protein [Afifella sp. IM 167]|uniref:glycosyltransferase family 2 protein n=1 Tax=Afifella sp. IM 167 TaxID=2033586 RepID=UPI001CC9A68E|nr:glycosyltransferase family 2 protein [Afifella sp. IM 167]MBZ8134433.1 glycosyl transferase [Afifella sp. IM 167]